MTPPGAERFLRDARTHLRQRIKYLREIAVRQDSQYRALGLIASICKSVERSGSRRHALFHLLRQEGMSVQKRTGIAGAVVKLVFPEIKRTKQSRYIAVLGWALRNGLEGRKLEIRLRDYGGIDAIDAMARKKDANSAIRNAKRELSGHVLATFRLRDYRPNAVVWLPLIASMTPWGRVSVHAAVLRENALVRRFLRTWQRKQEAFHSERRLKVARRKTT